MAATWTAPAWARSLYGRFPLLVLEQEDPQDWTADPPGEHPAVLWIHPPAPARHPHHRPALSADPASARTQLLFLLRDTAARPDIHFKPWPVQASAPGRVLPALHLPRQARVLPRDDIRPWLEACYPLSVNPQWQGFPTEQSYNTALSLSSLVHAHLLPAYLASLPRPPPTWYLSLSVPPPLSAGLTTPLPASLTGDSRDVDHDEILRKGIEALAAVEGLVQDGWAMGAERPTSLDALVASHLYAIYALPEGSLLRDEAERSTTLGEYIERVLDFAESQG